MTEARLAAALNRACLSYRHDFGLMSPEDRARLVFQARQWLRAFEHEGLATLREEREPPASKFRIGDRVRKIKGSSWHGRIVGTYSTTLTPEGYAVESEREPGSVQIYPATALEPTP